MAKVGDGNPRSERRRLTATLSLRLGDAEKRRFEAAAKRGGHPSLAAWALDRMRQAGDAGLRDRRVLCGKLGMLGARLEDLARTSATRSPDALQHDLRVLGKAIVTMQNQIMKGAADAGEGDP
jgi:hypothetical protein